MTSQNKNRSKSKKEGQTNDFLTLFPQEPKNYFHKTRHLPTSLAFIFPLFIIYQIGILTTGGLVNGVDFVTNSLMALSNGSTLTYLTYALSIAAIYIIIFLYLKKKDKLHLHIFPGVFLESLVYASLLGGVIISVMIHLGLGSLLQPNCIASPLQLAANWTESGPLTNTIMSIGAGLYEETVFRLILLSGLYYFCDRILKYGPILSCITALILSSLVFSGIHYIGPLADTFTLGSFIFRFFAGVAFAVIFYFRGFAIAVYTHAIYDILVLVFQ